MSDNMEIETDATAVQCSDHMVVVGTLNRMTDTRVSIDYLGLEGKATILIDRQDFGPCGSVGVKLPDTELRAFSFKRMDCGLCENNNEGEHKRRHIIKTENEEGEEVSTTNVCDTCNGKGRLDSFGTNTPVIDGEHGLITDTLAQGEIPEGARPVFPSMFKGNRSGRTDDWDVEIVPKHTTTTNIHGDTVSTLPAVIQHYNEQYASENNNFIGHPIGRPVTANYATKQHEEMLGDFITLADDADLPYTLWGANRGQDAYMDIMLAENGTREEVMSLLKTQQQEAGATDYDDSQFGMKGLKGNPAGLIKFGVQIHHSFDGAFTIRGVAERVACLNGMVSTDAQTLLSVVHKKGVMDALDLKNLAETIVSAALSLWDEMSYVEGMTNIPLNGGDWERLLVIMEDRKIISYPGIGANGQLTGGRAFRAATQGWADPSQDWVAVDEEGQNTLYQAYNIGTGIPTHEPEANDIHGRVTGGRASSIGHTQKQQKKVHALMREVQMDAYDAYLEVMGEEPSNADDLAAFVAHNGIPMLNDVEADENGHVLPVLTRNLGEDGEQVKQLTAQFIPAQ